MLAITLHILSQGRSKLANWNASTLRTVTQTPKVVRAYIYWYKKMFIHGRMYSNSGNPSFILVKIIQTYTHLGTIILKMRYKILSVPSFKASCFLLFVCVNVLPAHIYVNQLHTLPAEASNGCWIPGTGVQTMVSCFMGYGNRTWLLRELS